MMGLLEWTALGTLGLTAIVLVALWDLVWKGIALWRCGRNKQLAWFICILIFNTAGILPIVYLIFFQRGKKKKKRR